VDDAHVARSEIVGERAETNVDHAGLGFEQVIGLHRRFSKGGVRAGAAGESEAGPWRAMPER
jgi:hypothetical protein